MRWMRRAFTSAGITQVPPGPYLAERQHGAGPGTVKVTSPNYDDIGQVLTTLGVDYVSFDGDYEDCDLLFINCGTSDRLDAKAVRALVDRGGCVYASDLTSSFLDIAFRGMFQWGGSGSPGPVEADIVDPELREVMGERTTVTFDMSGWSILTSSAGATLLAGAQSSLHPRVPLMVGVQVGQGAVFYTSFHNRAQVSEHERLLLQLLVLKQIGARSGSTLEQASRTVGVDLTALVAGAAREPGDT